MSQRKIVMGLLVLALAAVVIWQYPALDYQWDYHTCLLRHQDHYSNIAGLQNAPDRATYNAQGRLQCKGFESDRRFQAAESEQEKVEWGLKAVVAYSSLIEDHRNVSYRSDRAAVYAGLGRYERSLADYDYLIAIDPDNYWMYENRAKLYLQMGQSADALYDYKALLAQAQDDTSISQAFLDRIAAVIARLEGVSG